MQEQEIIARITGRYPDASVDVSGEGCSFEVYVISPDFEGVKTLDRQRGILSLFSAELETGKLHALGVKAKTPAEMQGGSGLVQITS